MPNNEASLEPEQALLVYQTGLAEQFLRASVDEAVTRQQNEVSFEVALGMIELYTEVAEAMSYTVMRTDPIERNDVVTMTVSWD